MRLTVNGQDRDTGHPTLAALWAAETAHLRVPTDANDSMFQEGGLSETGSFASAGALEPPSRRGFAIALNGEVVRVGRWDETALNEGDRVEIIRAVAGG